ncbi:3-oxoacyl-[acyl-carrier-protein] reductase FabG [Aplysia californica]|uniref:3-oxoacyl-[acyl-carrier-protein] reductase FabG n=1 Tax=Aplysia californica TaxID=6500 RepID=A0ABM0JIQ5_APLCA|nr:3-oxoacyl-[acyl-carrier-protein] reductase FabG [Aplysia californica]
MSSQDFAGKSVVVTGSNSGIGESIALLLAQRGAMVTLCGRDEERLQSVLGKCQEASGGNSDRFITVQGDLNDKAARDRILEETIAKFGKLDVLIANAGVSPKTKIEDDTEELFDFVFNTNLKSVYFLIQAALPLLEKTKGNIVCVSSIVSTMPVLWNQLYQMAKAGMDQLVRTLALSQGPKGIRVNAINPTIVLTRLHERQGQGEARKRELEENMGRRHPLHARSSTPEEQAEVAVFLASDGAGFVTGQCVKVDGGITLGKRE